MSFGEFCEYYSIFGPVREAFRAWLGSKYIALRTFKEWNFLWDNFKTSRHK
jgi:hypothetical protein